MSVIMETWSGARWIGFPWRVKKEIRGIKFRIFPKDVVMKDGKPKLPRFRREAGYKSVLFNRDILDWKNEKGERFKSAILASGETDAMALLTMGYRSVVATTTGETAMPEDMLKDMDHLEKIWILYDSDDVGFEAANKLAKRIGANRALIVRLPKETKDANEFMKKHGAEAKAKLDEVIKQAVKLNIPSVYHVTDIIERIREGFVKEGQEIIHFTPWRALNAVIPNFTGLVVVSAPQGTGKTTWGLNVATHWAKQMGKGALFYCLEMSPEELVAKIVMAEYKVTLEELKAGGTGALTRFEYDFGEKPLYVGYSPSLRKPGDVIELLRQAALRFELECVFFDNIHVLGRGRDKRDMIGEFTLGLKDLAMELGIPVVAIAQPRKLDPGQIMTAWDLKDSVDVYSDADQILILHRQQLAASKDADSFSDDPPEQVFSPYTLLRVYKSRFGTPRDIMLCLEGKHHFFRDLNKGESIEYRGKRGAHRRSDVWADLGYGGGDDQEEIPDWVTDDEDEQTDLFNGGGREPGDDG
jgi:replicative DNA helicase